MAKEAEKEIKALEDEKKKVERKRWQKGEKKALEIRKQEMQRIKKGGGGGIAAAKKAATKEKN